MFNNITQVRTVQFYGIDTLNVFTYNTLTTLRGAKAIPGEYLEHKSG